MKKLRFKTNSRHISQLGRELVTDFVTALVELIKNSYDADAQGVNLIIENANTPESKITLIDTGCGMTVCDFEDKWMTIGTNNKVTEPYTKNGRKKSGKKGIGRFSVERIAEKVTIYSFTKQEEPFKVHINWNRYEEVNIAALKQRINILKDHKDHNAAKFISNQLEFFFLSDEVDQEDKNQIQSIIGVDNFDYTYFYDIEILDRILVEVLPILKKYENIEQLVEDIESNLEYINNSDDEEIFNLINKFNTENNFNTQDNFTGVVLVMEGLRDEWNQGDINKLQKELRLLVAPMFIEKDPFEIKLLADDFIVEDYVLGNDILDLSFAKVEGRIYNNAKNLYIAYEDINKNKHVIEENFDEPLICGDVTVELYFFLRESKHLSNSDKGYNYRHALNVLDTFCGIKIYRDSFRIKPYGDIGNDWLLLDQSKVKDTHGYLVGNNQVIGIVSIGDETNPLLIDSTNREGIIENEAYAQLVKFVQKCTDLISQVRREEYKKKQDALKKLEEEQKKLEEDYKKFKNEYNNDEVVGKINEIINNSLDETVRTQLNALVDTYKENSESKKEKYEEYHKKFENNYKESKERYEEKIEFQQNELNLYKNLATLGMLTGSFGHETNDIVNRLQLSIVLASKLVDRQRFLETKEILETMDNDFSRLHSYSKLITNFLKRRKRGTINNININNVLEEVVGLYFTIVKTYGISLSYECADSVEIKMQQIDLESIIINMITNAFEQVKGLDKKYVRVRVEEDLDTIIILFEDSGLGVPKGEEKNIFRAFNTSKDDGIGLGLNIVNDIVENYKGTISVKRSDDLNGAKFVVKFPKET